MTRNSRISLARAIAGVVLGTGLLLNAAAANAQEPTNTVKMTLTTGEVTIKLLPEIAPQHVERVKQLVKDDFYNGIVFHRVIPNFMAQSGDPTGTGTGGSKYGNISAEFTNERGFKAGTVGAARTNDPNTANSQFFICHTDQSCRHLNGQYTIWGQVTSGMEAVNKVKGPADKIVKAEFVR
ncbi:MAG: peptidylprolyl isomerase [Pseudomonadota bacterium]